MLLLQIDADEISETVQADRVAFKDQMVLIGLCGRQVRILLCDRTSFAVLSFAYIYSPIVL